jgi:hypothetical protein
MALELNRADFRQKIGALERAGESHRGLLAFFHEDGKRLSDVLTA